MIKRILTLFAVALTLSLITACSYDDDNVVFDDDCWIENEKTGMKRARDAEEEGDVDGCSHGEEDVLFADPTCDNCCPESEWTDANGVKDAGEEEKGDDDDDDDVQFVREVRHPPRAVPPPPFSSSHGALLPHPAAAGRAPFMSPHPFFSPFAWRGLFRCSPLAFLGFALPRLFGSDDDDSDDDDSDFHPSSSEQDPFSEDDESDNIATSGASEGRRDSSEDDDIVFVGEHQAPPRPPTRAPKRPRRGPSIPRGAKFRCKKEDVADNCSICLCPLGEAQVLVRSRKCGHFFCLGCISEWLSRYKKVCPLCKASLCKSNLQHVLIEDPQPEPAEAQPEAEADAEAEDTKPEAQSKKAT